MERVWYPYIHGEPVGTKERGGTIARVSASIPLKMPKGSSTSKRNKGNQFK
jgi:hypothetical protein